MSDSLTTSRDAVARMRGEASCSEAQPNEQVEGARSVDEGGLHDPEHGRRRHSGHGKRPDHAKLKIRAGYRQNGRPVSHKDERSGEENQSGHSAFVQDRQVRGVTSLRQFRENRFVTQTNPDNGMLGPQYGIRIPDLEALIQHAFAIETQEMRVLASREVLVAQQKYSRPHEGRDGGCKHDMGRRPTTGRSPPEGEHTGEEGDVRSAGSGEHENSEQ
jgi:hypothetical protein